MTRALRARRRRTHRPGRDRIPVRDARRQTIAVQTRPATRWWPTVATASRETVKSSFAARLPSRKGRIDPLSSLEQARRVAALAQEKLAQDVVILDMRPVCTYTDFFVVCTGQNPRQTKAIFDEVHGRLKQEGLLLPRSVEGQTEARWIVADYYDLVLHVFTPETRAFYRLEDLWGDVPTERLEAAAS